MRWMKRRLRNWLMNDPELLAIPTGDRPSPPRGLDIEDGTHMVFRRADNGTIIQYNSYNPSQHVKSGMEHRIRFRFVMDGEKIGDVVTALLVSERLNSN